MDTKEQQVEDFTKDQIEEARSWREMYKNFPFRK